MVERIVTFRTSDGKIFESPEDAEEHEWELEKSKIFKSMREAISKEINRAFENYGNKQ